MYILIWIIMYLIYLLHIEWNKPIRGAVVVVIVK